MVAKIANDFFSSLYKLAYKVFPKELVQQFFTSKCPFVEELPGSLPEEPFMVPEGEPTVFIEELPLLPKVDIPVREKVVDTVHLEQHCLTSPIQKDEVLEEVDFVREEAQKEKKQPESPQKADLNEGSIQKDRSFIFGIMGMGATVFLTSFIYGYKRWQLMMHNNKFDRADSPWTIFARKSKLFFKDNRKICYVGGLGLFLIAGSLCKI